MARLISVNVGLPRDIEWRGKTVHTGIWKASVQGRRRVNRLNVEGDGQGDLGGHGGEQRAVFVYQAGSYRHWEQQLGRSDFTHGQFGENFTIEGLPDDEVCIGDRYRIGSALFEVTQPRVTCYRVGIRTNEPRMAALLTSSGRPGFYLRVLEEGEVGADDEIVTVARGPERMTVAEVNALLYSPHHPRERLEKALRITALSPGWRWSFEELVRSQLEHPVATGNAGLVAGAGARTAAPGFRPLRVARIDRECADVISFSLEPMDGAALTKPLAGQFVVLRLRPKPDGPLLFRSYSLSGSFSGGRYRISVKIEPDGAAGRYLHSSIAVGDVIDVSEPRGAFVLQPAQGQGPVVLLSAGIGATPVLAMLHAMAESASAREVWWLHGARDGKTHSFGEEARQLVAGLAHGRSHVWYSRPDANDLAAHDDAHDDAHGDAHDKVHAYDTAGRFAVEALDALHVPRSSDFYLCGPSGFLGDAVKGLAAWGVPAQRIHSEVFAGGPSMMPGVIASEVRAPHRPEGAPGTGPLVSFARSGISVRWRPSQDQSLLELAEACDVPVRWSCRTGVCHNCESGLVSGGVDYRPEPLDPPAQGNVLLCCARPQGDVVIDI
ncbi:MULTISPECIES: MOSC and FAD-binding oxidoreductase domain-containing protein [unclassified Variovorax]|uniref:MOSC and FAD-binding oxidoreductase domain-containing protein n=1 Tax=unclassified Variovorax TaxID=663243 RepID=UPI0008B439FB|nr:MULTISPECIES: MOSC and FAD-binding oxidoreductase domain-containing protein [unclassified Variovorax]SEK14682.1 MOSC domain-containing protein YiiM [Variovorax sp. OK202]SFE02120.1 MOSC domain-containing protein YiiM [Variovorax sp. OK212]